MEQGKILDTLFDYVYTDMHRQLAADKYQYIPPEMEVSSKKRKKVNTCIAAMIVSLPVQFIIRLELILIILPK